MRGSRVAGRERAYQSSEAANQSKPGNQTPAPRQRRELAIVSETGEPGLSASLVGPQARQQDTKPDAGAQNRIFRFCDFGW
jgi:hypothetical protein